MKYQARCRHHKMPLMPCVRHVRRGMACQHAFRRLDRCSNQLHHVQITIPFKSEMALQRAVEHFPRALPAHCPRARRNRGCAASGVGGENTTSGERCAWGAQVQLRGLIPPWVADRLVQMLAIAQVPLPLLAPHRPQIQHTNCNSCPRPSMHPHPGPPPLTTAVPTLADLIVPWCPPREDDPAGIHVQRSS